jgi:hypothetical protein
MEDEKRSVVVLKGITLAESGRGWKKRIWKSPPKRWIPEYLLSCDRSRDVLILLKCSNFLERLSYPAAFPSYPPKNRQGYADNENRRKKGGMIRSSFYLR